MDDRTGDDLMLLAPEVDMSAARAAFTHRRAQARRRRRVGSAALATLVVLAGIGAWAAVPEDQGAVVDSGLATVPDEPAPTPGPLEPIPTSDESTPPVQESADSCARPVGSSPATFDPAGGIYAAHISAFDPAASTLTFDVVQWLSGDDAVAAYQRDNPGATDSPPNDYYIDNESDTVRSAPVAPDAAVRLLRLAGPGREADPKPEGVAAVVPGSLAELSEYLSTGIPETVYWLTVADGTVTGICEQYRP